MITQLRFPVMLILISSFCAALPDDAQGQGMQLFGIGTVNRSMGGAATAAPIEAIGGLAYNPATISQMENQLSFSAEVITPLVDMQSTLFSSGANTSEPSWTAVPSMGLVYRPQQDSPVTLGLGVFGIAGYSLNYPATTANPLNFPQVPTGTTPTPGFGNVFADLSILQIVPSIAVSLSPTLTVAAGPTITSGRLLASPFVFAPPDDADGDGAFTYPTGSGSRYSWGGGFHAGLYWQGPQGWNFGASYRSPQWLQKFQQTGVDENGFSRSFDFDFDYPQILSLGTGYTGFDRWTLAADVRWMDWDSTDTIGTAAGFGPDGRVAGLGWKSTWSLSLGAQYKISEIASLRAGYMLAESPIDNSNAFFSSGAPLILEQSVNCGGSLRLSRSLSAHAVYSYAIENEVSGPIHSVAGPIPGSNVSYRVSAHALSFGVSVLF